MANTETLSVEVRGVDNLSPVLKSLESGVIRFVGAVSSALTVVSTIGFPVAAAATFQQQLIEVKKTTDFTNEALATMKTGLIDLSKTTNVAANELARIAALGGQMGIGEQGPDALLAFTEELARAVTALDVSADVAAPALGKLINIFQLSQAEFGRAVAVINQLSNVSTATAEELFDVMRRIGDAGGSLTYAQSAALSALAMDIGLTAETAGTTFTKIFADMKADAGDFAAFMGMSTADWVEVIEADAIKALELFAKKLNALPVEVASAAKVELTGGGRIFEAITKIQNQLKQGETSRLRTLLREANAEWEVGTSAIREQQNVLSGTIAQWEIFKNRVRAVFIAGGDRALAAINDALRSLGDTLDSSSFREGFAEFIESGVNAMRQLSAAISSVLDLLGSAKVDWDTIFDIGKLLTLIATLKLIPKALGSLGGLSGLTTTKGRDPATGEIVVQLGLMARLQKAARDYIATKQQEREVEAEVGALKTQLWANAAQQAERSNRAQATAALASQQYAAAANQVETLRYGLLRNRATMLDGLASREAAYHARMSQLEAARAEALERYNTALAAGDTAAAKRAKTEAASLGRALGGVRSGMGQAIERERVQVKAALDRMVAEYKAALDRFRTIGATNRANRGLMQQELRALEAEQIALRGRLGELQATVPAAAAATQSIAAVYRQSGLLNAAWLATQRGASGLSRAFSLAGKGAGLLWAGLSKLLSVLIFIDLGKMVADMFGWTESIKKFADSVISSVNKLTGLELPTFGGAKEAKKAEEDVIAAIQLRKKLYAESERFTRRFGTVNMDVSADPQKFYDSLAEVKNNIRVFVEDVGASMQFGNDTGILPTEAFLQGMEVLQDYEVRLRAIAARMDEINAGGAGSGDMARSDAIARELADLEIKAKVYGDTEDIQKRVAALTLEQSHIQDAIHNRAVETWRLEQEAAVVTKGRVDLLKQMLAGFDASAQNELFGGDQLMAQLVVAKRAYDDAIRARDELNKKVAPQDIATIGTENSSESAKALREELDKAGAAADTAKARYSTLVDQIAKAAPIISLAGKDARTFVEAFARQGADKNWSFLSALDGMLQETDRGLDGVFKGTAKVNTSIEEQNRLAANLVFGREMSRAYGMWAQSATTAAEQVKNKIAQTIAQNRRDIEELISYFLGIDQQLRANTDTAIAQTADRKSDTVTEKKLFELDLRKQKELDLIDVQRQGGAITEEQAKRAEFAVKQRYDAEIQKIKDVSEYAKAERQADTLKSRFTTDRLEAEALRKEIESINAQLQSSALTPAQRDALLPVQQSKVAELEERIKSLRGSLDQLATVEPVGGRLVVTEAELAPLKQVISSLTNQAGGMKVEGLTAMQSQYETLAKNLDEGRKAADDMVRMSTEGIQRIARELGTVGTVLSDNIIAAIANNPALEAAISQFREKVNAGLSDTTGIRFDPAALSNAAGEFAAQWKRETGALSLTLPDVKPPTNISSLLQSLNQDIKKALEVEIRLTVGKTDGSGTATGKVNAYASGGPVFGAGGFRSDSILARLSHGEYVVDALTVRMFGPGFFKFLQSIAKTGTNIAGLIPGFSTGAYIGTLPRPTSVSKAAAAAARTVIDVKNIFNRESSDESSVTLNVNLNGTKRAQVRGSRAEIDNLVEALYDLRRA